MTTDEAKESNGDERETAAESESPDDGDEQHTPTADDLSDEGKKKVEEMQQAYDDDRPTAVLPGTDNTITGVAVNEWLDDDGNPKFGKDEDSKDEDSKDETKAEDNSDDAKDEEKQDAS